MTSFIKNRVSLAVVFVFISLVTPLAKADPPAGEKFVPIPEFADEFNGGRLDVAKWDDHNPEWPGRKPGLFSKDNVSVADGLLNLTAKAEDLPGEPAGYHTYTTAAVKSKTPVLYGYFEIRAKPMKSAASSAFWFYNNTKESWTEIDVFELCGVPPVGVKNDYMTTHIWHTPRSRFTRQAR